MERRFGASRCLLALVCVMSLKLGNVSAITIEDLFPLKDGETILKRGDNAESGLIVLDPPFPLLGVNHTNISVSTNGLLYFDNKDAGAIPSISLFTTNTLIAPFWGDADTTHSGIVSYGITTDTQTLTMAREFIRVAFPGQASFVPLYLFVALWDSVGYFGGNGDLVNTFQCVLATDGTISFIIFLYPMYGIQWTAGDTHGSQGKVDPNSDDSVGAIAGIHLVGHHAEFISDSGSDATVNLPLASNFELPGVWMFQVDKSGTVSPPECLVLQASQNETESATSTNVGAIIGGIIGMLAVISIPVIIGVVGGYVIVMKVYFRRRKEQIIAERSERQAIMDKEAEDEFVEIIPAVQRAPPKYDDIDINISSVD